MKESSSVSQQIKTRSSTFAKNRLRYETKHQKNIKINNGRTKQNKNLKNDYRLITRHIIGTEYWRKKLFRNIDVRYLKEISKFINKYSNYYNPNMRLEKRHDRHKLECHNHRWNTNCKNFREQGVTVSPSVTKLKLCSAKCTRTSIDIESQTTITLTDNIAVPLRKCSTRLIDPKRNIYKEHLKNEIINWLQNVPIFYSVDFTANYLKNNIAVTLVERIDRLSKHQGKDIYEKMVKNIISDCLDILPMWLPNSKQDQSVLKTNLRDRFYEGIVELNSKFRVSRFERGTEELELNRHVESKNKLNIVDDKYVKEVIDWLDKLMFSEPISRQQIILNIKKLISSILYEPVETKNIKFILQGKIIEILEKLPIRSDYVENKSVCLNRFAEDLANRLIIIKIDLDSPIKQVLLNEDNVHNQKCNSGMPESPTHNEIIRIVGERVEKILQNENICNRNLIKIEISKVILNSFESRLSGTDRNVNNEISDILFRKCSLTQDKALLLAEKIYRFVRNHLKNGDTADKLNEQLKSNPLLGIVSVYRSTDCIPVTASPKSLDSSDWEETFVAKSMDLLKDEISMWMKDHSLEICVCNSKNNRDKLVTTLALRLQDNPRNDNGIENVIESDIRQWLNVVVRPGKKDQIELLTQNLKEHIIRISRNTKLQAINGIAETQHSKIRQNIPNVSESKDLNSSPEDCDVIMKEMIFKYIEYKQESDDPLAKGAFSHLLVTELKRLNRSKRTKLCKNCENHSSHKPFRPEIINRELEYIKMISDWLRNIPLTPSYNRRGNKSRIDFIIQLANSIQEKEDLNCSEMEYDTMISSVINESIYSYNLPILPEHSNNVHLMVQQLLFKVKANRSQIYHNFSTISHTEELNLSNFLEEYINMEGTQIVDDEMKLEVWITRLLQEVKTLLNEDSGPSTEAEVEPHNTFSQIAVPKDPLIYFGLEMSCAKEISNWLKNIPILPVVNVSEIQKLGSNRIRAIAELATKLAEREILNNESPMDNTYEKNLVEYVTNWISRLPLDPQKNIVFPVLIQQLMNRIKRIHTGNYNNNEAPNYKEINLISRKRDSENINKQTLNSINTDSKHIKQSSMNNINPGLKIAEFIENWSNNLPIKEDSDVTRPIKADIARKLYQKIGEFTIDPNKYHNEILYKELLEDEVDKLFENLQQSTELQNNYEKLKSELITTILNIKKALEQKWAGANYKHKLLTTLNASIPNPVHNKEIIEPGFEIYKNYIANLFILENFDHSNEEIKFGYERRIKHEIDKYFVSAQNKNALPLNNEQMYNELYSELFKVPMPKEDSVIDEVEEVKTRCEIDTWFENLPIAAINDNIEMLHWDQILSVLTKKLHYIEKNESKPEEKIRKEIKKCILKFPLLPEKKEYIDDYIDKLQNTLKLSAENRTCSASIHKSLKNKFNFKSKCKSCVKKVNEKGTNSNSGIEISAYSSKNATVSNHLTFESSKNPEDLMEEIVQNWCNDLPWIGDQLQIKTAQNNTISKIMIKLFELNMDLDVFNDDMLYDHLLDEELEKIILNLHLCCNFSKSKSAKKFQLKEMIKGVKLLIKKEKSRHDYKTELNKIIENILNDHNSTATNLVKFNNLRDEIVNNFILYNYNKEDYIIQQQYKGYLLDDVIKYDSEIKDNGDQINPLIRRNQLLCELSKISIPCETALQEEVEEIKMRNEVEQLFKKNGLNDNTEKTAQIKKILTKRLNDIEKAGHTKLIHTKMITFVAKCINKLGKKLNSKIVEQFVNSLKDNEAERKTHPFVEIQNKNDNLGPQSFAIVSDRNELQNTSQGNLPYSSCEYGNMEFQDPYQANQTVNFFAAQIPRGDQSNKRIDGLRGPNQHFGPNSPQIMITKNQYNEPWCNSKLSSNEHRIVNQPRVMNCIQDSNFGNGNYEGEYVFTSSTDLSGIPRNESQCGTSCQREEYAFRNNVKAAINTRIHRQAQPIQISYPTIVSPDPYFKFSRQLNNSLQLTEYIPGDSAQFSSQILLQRNVPIRPIKRRSKYSSQINLYDDGKYRCTCVKKPKCLGEAYCLVPIDEHCFECGGFRPKLCKVLLPV